MLARLVAVPWVLLAVLAWSQLAGGTLLFGGPRRGPLAAGNQQNGPCDIAELAGTPCVAAHSVTRRLWKRYGGPLFQLTRVSDNTTQDVGFLPNGVVNQSEINTFCSGTTCTFSLIYDQMHTAANGNNLPQATGTNQAPLSYTTFSNGKTLPIVATVPGVYYRNRNATVGIPTGNASITEYEVINTFQWSYCCGSYGDMENPVRDTGTGSMFALGLVGGEGNATIGTGSGPWPGVDWENGVWSYGQTPNTILLNLLAKYNLSTNTWALKADAGLNGTLALLNSSAPPATPAFQGGISLGEGGDGTNATTGFHEGIIIAGATSDATDNTVAANVATFYNSFGTPSEPAQILVTDLGNFNNSSSPASLHPASATPSGALIIAFGFDVSLSAATTGAITDTQGNTYNLVATVNRSGIGNFSLFYCWNCHALSPSDSITYTDANAVALYLDAAYATGVLSSSDPLDSAATNSGTFSGNSPSVTSGAPAASGDLFVGLIAGDASIAATYSPGWLVPFSYAPNTSPNNIVGGTTRNPATGTLTYAPSGGSPGGGEQIIAAFKHQ
jgi:hypothetical protein